MLHTTNVIIRLSWILAAWIGVLSFVDHVQPPELIALALAIGAMGLTLAALIVQQPFPIWRDADDIRYSVVEESAALLGRLAVIKAPKLAPKLFDEVPPELIKNTQASLAHLSTFIERLTDESPTQRLIVNLRATLDHANEEKKEDYDIINP